MATIESSSAAQVLISLFLPQELDKQYRLFLGSDLSKMYQTIP